MRPRLATNNLVDLGSTDSVALREHFKGAARCAMLGDIRADLQDIILRKYVTRIVLSAPNFVAVSLLAHHVLSVVMSRADEQMVRIEAPRLVAMVENEIFGIQTEPQPEPRCNAVNAHVSRLRVENWKRCLSISLGLARLRPDPALRRVASVFDAAVRQQTIFKSLAVFIHALRPRSLTLTMSSIAGASVALSDPDKRSRGRGHQLWCNR